MVSLLKRILGVTLLCCFYLTHSTIPANIPSPYYLEPPITQTIPSNAVIVDSAANGTHIAILDSYYVLRVYSYASSGSITFTQQYDAGPWFPNSGSSWSHSRFLNTGAVAMHPQTGDLYIAAYYPESNYASLKVWKFSSALAFIYELKISSPENYFQQQAKNIRINLHAESNFLYIGVYHNNAYTSAAPGFFIAKYDWSIYQYTAIQSSSNALAIGFACNNIYICVWTSSRSLTKYRMDSLAFVQNQTLSLSATQINFDPVIRNFDSTGASVYFQRLFNDSSRYVISALSSQVELLQSVTLPYIVDFPNIPSYDCRIDSDGNILAASTSIMNSSIGLGSTEILVSTINSTSGALSSTVVVSTIRQDNVSRIYLPSTSSVIVTGTTDGNLSAPSSQLTGRRFFLARFQRISVNTIETSTSGRIAKGETFKISFTSLPSAARTSGLPTVMLQSRPCTSVIWINATTISGVAPTAIGKSVELFVSYYYLPQTPSVVDFRLSYPDPVITEVTPSQGPAIGFDITITVNHLGIPGNDTVNVMIGNSPCNNITQIASDKITCRVPFGTGVLHRLIVSTEPAAKSTENVFISYDPPRLNAVSPSVGATAGNTIVRLSGQNFGQCPQTPPCSSNISVTIGGKSCSSVLLLNDTNVECRSPANIGKNHSVIIDVGGRTAQNVSALFSYEKPAISSLVPSTASTSKPTIYVEGSNFGIFENIPTVQLISENGTYECPSVTWKSDSSIKCDFNNVSLPFDVTFLVTVSVGGQLNRENLNATFRAGIINNAPSAAPSSIFMSEDTVTVITLQGSDTDLGDLVQMYVVSAPSNGQLYQFSPTALNSKGQVIDPSLSPIAVSDSLGRVVYIPQAEYSGNDTFKFLARDQYLTESSDVNASITIQEVADFPIPVKAEYRFFEDDQNFITLKALDPDSPLTDIDFYILSLPKGQLFEVDVNDTLSAVIQTVPYHLVADRVLYKPPQNEFGDFFTSFSFSVSDGTSLRMDVNATVSISIQSVNDIPLASNMTYSAPEDSDFTVFFGCSDVDLNDRSTVVIKGVPPPEAGVLYQADQQYRAVLDRNGRIYENDTVIGSAVYVPLKNYFGSFNVPYSCVDSSQAESADATITVNVLNINDPPVAKDISIRIDEDSVAEFLLDPTDVESPFESLSVIILDLPQQGLLFIESTSNVTNTTWLPIKTAPFGPTFVKKLKFIPTTNSFGISVFHYLTQDGTDVSVYNGTVVISVEPINDPPTLILPGNAMEFFEDTETVIQFTVVDVDEGQPLVKVSNIHINGSLFHVGVHSSSKTELLIGEGSEISGPPYRVLFIPQPNYFTNSGIEGVPQNFEVQLTDFSSNTSISHTFQFDIRPVNDPPKLTCGTIELPQGQITEATAVHTFEIVADDPDNQNLTYYLASAPKRGFLVDHDNRVLSANDAFTSRQLVFSSNSTGGGYPYANFSVYVIDEHGSQSNLCMFHFIFSCPARTYNNIFLSGGPICTTCPDGASCNSDGREMPIANPGYWKSYENNTAFLPCIPKEACSGDGAALAECARGYTGTRCGACAPGYYRLFQTCRTCNTAVPDWVLPVLFLLGIFVLGAIAVLLRKGPSSGLLNIGLNFIQIITVFDYTLEFSPVLRSTLQILTVSQFNVEISAPECVLTKANLTDTYDIRFKFKFSLIIPALLLGFCALIPIVQSYPITWCLNQVKGTIQTLHNRLRNIDGSKFIVPEQNVLQQQSRSMLHSIQIFNMLLGIIYIMLVNYSLAIFDCTLQPDQNFYLDSQPNAKCYEDWHPEYVQFGIFAIVVYVLGIPLYFGTLLFCYYQSKFFTPNWNRAREIAAHVLDIPNSYFKESHQYFIVVQLLRKLLIVSIKLFLERLPVLQAVLTGFILSIDAILYTKYLPYTFTLLNVLEVTCTLFAMVIMNAGLLIHTDQLSPSQKDAASLIILSLIVISVGSCAAVAIYDTMIRAKKVVQETHQKRQQLQYIESLKIGGSLKREPSRARDHGGFQAASGNSAAKLLTGLGI